MPDREGTECRACAALAWFLTGAVIGAAVAILYTPNSGKDTRTYIGRKTTEAKTAVSDTSADLMERGRDMYTRGKQLMDDAQELFERGRKLVRG